MTHAIVRGNTAFALDLYRRQPAGNVFFSPHSISTAMAMVAAGARGATAKEIESVLHLPFGGAQLAQAWAALPGGGLISANSMWPALDIELRASYVEMARQSFAAAIERLDYAHAAEAARARVNAWVAEATRGKIRNLLAPHTVQSDTRLILANAIYMKAPWASQFQADRTNENGRFFADGGEVTVPLMAQTNSFRYFHGDGVKVVELPYEGNELSLLVVLPDDLHGLASIELTPETLARWERQLKMCRVSVVFPRFSSEIGLELGETLQSMGIRLAFDLNGAADFSGISESEHLAISEVVHKARIDVTEEGTEAAAATAILLWRAAAFRKEPEPETFHADHPFFFAIRRRSNQSMLFIGRLVKPQ
jgi:serpin B